MDDDSCVMKYIEIVPFDKFRNSSDFTDVKEEPDCGKVCIYWNFNVFACFSFALSLDIHLLFSLFDFLHNFGFRHLSMKGLFSLDEGDC